MRKLEVVHKEVGGYLLIILIIMNHSVTQFVPYVGIRAALSAKKPLWAKFSIQ